MKLTRDNLMLAPFPDLKELTSEIEIKLKQNHIICDYFYSKP